MDSADIPQPVGARTDRALALPAMRHLENLESEAIFILRETAAEFSNPVLLFSGGKDSTVLLRLAEKAFRPGRLPFPLLHVDTGHNFLEVIEFATASSSSLASD
jgi:sulfate adenylyltransferase subunit 2